MLDGMGEQGSCRWLGDEGQQARRDEELQGSGSVEQWKAEFQLAGASSCSSTLCLPQPARRERAWPVAAPLACGWHLSGPALARHHQVCTAPCTRSPVRFFLHTTTPSRSRALHKNFYFSFLALSTNLSVLHHQTLLILIILLTPYASTALRNHSSPTVVSLPPRTVACFTSTSTHSLRHLPQRIFDTVFSALRFNCIYQEQSFFSTTPTSQNTQQRIITLLPQTRRPGVLKHLRQPRLSFTDLTASFPPSS